MPEPLRSKPLPFSRLTIAAALAMAGICASHYLRLGFGVTLPLFWLGAALAVFIFGIATRYAAMCASVSVILIGGIIDTAHWSRLDDEDLNGRLHEAVIVEAPRHKAKTSQMKVRLAGQRLSPVMLTVWRDTTLLQGQHIVFTAKEIKKVKPELHHSFHYDTWLLHQGVGWRIFAIHHAIVPNASRQLTLKERLIERLRRSPLSPRSEAIVEAMTLGSRSNITPELRETYSKAGASHLLALSGLHLSIVTAFALLLFARSHRLRFLRLLIVLPLVWSYVWLTGAPPSLVRAATMLSAWIAADTLNRRINGIDSLSLAVMIILAVRPFWLFDTGFQLSVASVLGIAAFVTLAGGVRFNSRLLRYLYPMLVTSVGATFATAPIVAATFHQLPLLGWATNMVYIPITTVVVPASLVFIAAPLPLIGKSIDILLDLQLTLMQHSGLVVDNLHPSWLTVVLAYATMLLFFCRRYWPMAFAAATLILSLVADSLNFPQLFP